MISENMLFAGRSTNSRLKSNWKHSLFCINKFQKMQTNDPTKFWKAWKAYPMVSISPLEVLQPDLSSTTNIFSKFCVIYAIWKVVFYVSLNLEILVTLHFVAFLHHFHCENLCLLYDILFFAFIVQPIKYMVHLRCKWILKYNTKQDYKSNNFHNRLLCGLRTGARL